MASHGWKTKADVLKDLVKVPGRVRVDENFIVRGCRPPPVLRSQQDEEELMLQFGVSSRERSTSSTNANDFQPDLNGIMEMVRMLDDYEDMAPAQDTGCDPDDVITISKLNPTVPEFIPKASSTSNTPRPPNNEEIITKNPSESANNVPMNKSDIKSTSIQENGSKTEAQDLGNIDIKKLDEKEFTSITNGLREKIKNASKVENRKEKNVAMISLLKMYAERSNEQANKVNEVTSNNHTLNLKQVLRTPDYFKTSVPHCDDESTEVSNNAEVLNSIHSPCKSIPQTTVSKDTEISQTSLLDLHDENEPQSPNALSEINDCDSEIKSSCEKVNQWLNPETKAEKKSPLQLKPITFRRKAVNGSRSPSVNENQSKKVARIDDFVPSQDAQRLAEKYMQRAKEREEAEKKRTEIVTLDNLDEKLRARDQQIKRRIKESGQGDC